jgi:hypothetical protein
MGRVTKYRDYVVCNGRRCESFRQGHVDYSAKVRLKRSRISELPRTVKTSVYIQCDRKNWWRFSRRPLANLSEQAPQIWPHTVGGAPAIMSPTFWGLSR